MKRIVHVQNIANQKPYAFNDATEVTISHIPAANVPVRISVLVGQNKVATNDPSGARLKCVDPQVHKFSSSKEEDESTSESK